MLSVKMRIFGLRLVIGTAQILGLGPTFIEFIRYSSAS